MSRPEENGGPPLDALLDPCPHLTHNPIKKDPVNRTSGSLRRAELSTVARGLRNRAPRMSMEGIGCDHTPCRGRSYTMTASVPGLLALGRLKT